MHDQVFQVLQAVQVLLQLRVAPACVMPDVAAAKAEVGAFHLQPPAVLAHHAIQQQQQAARLRGQRR